MRTARITLIVVVILGVLFVAADRIALAVAQGKAAERAQATEGLSDKPKISIKGFPFLTQAASGTLDHVTISADGVVAGGAGRTVEVQDFHADLYHVKLSDGYRSAKADRATGRALITYDELTKAAGGVTVSYAGPGKTDEVRITGSVREAKLSVLSKVTVADGQDDTVRLRAETVPEPFESLGLGDEVRHAIDFSPQLSHLPVGLHLQSVTTGKDGVTVTFSGTGVVLAN
jgi:hypothetical protein